MASSENPRLFIGIKIVPSRKILTHINHLQQSLPDSKIKWVNKENYHITIKFLGETPAYFINSIDLIIRQTLAKTKKFQVLLKGCGYFGKKTPQTIWLGLQQAEILNNIQSSLDKSLKELGFESGSKTFKPHLTIGRVKSLKSITRFSLLIDEISENIYEYIGIGQVELYESILKPSGPEYLHVKQYKLASG